MRSPWFTLFPGVFLLILSYIFEGGIESSRTTIIYLGIYIIIIVVFSLLRKKYDDWIAQKVNPIVLEYMDTKDVDKLYINLKKWSEKAITRTSKNIITLNLISILLEEQRNKEAFIEIEKFYKRVEDTDEYIAYHSCMVEYYKNTGQLELEKNELEKVSKIEEKQKKKSSYIPPANSIQSKKAFINWAIFDALVLGVYYLFPKVETFGDLLIYDVKKVEIINDLIIFILIISIFVTLGWLVMWGIKCIKRY